MEPRDPITERRSARAADGYVSSLVRAAARRRRAEAAGAAREPVDVGAEAQDGAPPAASTRSRSAAPHPGSTL